MKNIVICSDGTGNEYGQNNTNVVETYVVTRKKTDQTLFYDPGVGTGGWEYSESTGNLKAVADKATGAGLQRNVEDAYSFLMETYKAGDKIYLFGFSRGAFTVRSLAGMLYKCGLLAPDNDNLLEYASRIYNTSSKKDPGIREIAAGFKETFCRPCPVHFIGVWDTVESLVMNAGVRWHNTTLNPEAKNGFQALSIDERRKDFPPCIWDESAKLTGQTIEQVWFAGVHSNVGGWYNERGLSNIALHWMMGKAKQCGLDIDDNELQKRPPNPHDKLTESYSGFWKFRGSRTRKIAEGSRIHKSVKERMNNPANKYQPKNLPQNYVEVE
ncbi:MAG: DUF2235 domain-containing protein [Burkholderiales bacterium]